MPEPGFDILERELVELGRSIATAPPRDDLVAAVLARIGPVAGMPDSACARGRLAAFAAPSRRSRDPDGATAAPPGAGDARHDLS